jgi:hypothetical protein
MKNPSHKAALATASIIFVSLLNLTASPGITVEVDEQRGELEMRYQDRRVLLYSFATNQFKPYVRELYTLRGENMLRDGPADHPHHHGLMYAIRLNGTNFWEETGTPGVEKPIRILSQITRKTAGGLPQAQFTQLIHWLAFTNRWVADSMAAALFIEQRTLTLTIDTNELALRWDSAFEVGPNAGKVTLHGSQYNGLGMRLPKSFDKVARFDNSEGAPYTGAASRNLIPAKWTSVSGPVDSHEAMLVLFSHSKNARGHGNFYSLSEVFAYLSTTQGIDKEPLEYAPGARFHLNYLLAVYGEKKSREFIQNRYELWQREGR